MNEHDATEIAFKNGYKKGAKDTLNEVEKRLPTDRTFNNSDIQLGYAWAMSAVQNMLNGIKAERLHDEDSHQT